jgi:hypothetical protein
MIEWLLSLLLSLVNLAVPHAEPPKQDFVGMVAAEAAYSALLPDAAPVKPKVPTKDCTTCKGTGKVRTGDNQGWTKCPDCDPDLGDVKTPKSEPNRYKTSSCPNGRCELYQSYSV